MIQRAVVSLASRCRHPVKPLPKFHQTMRWVEGVALPRKPTPPELILMSLLAACLSK